jgi:prepilin-type processing-associated H-X9-DG protein
MYVGFSGATRSYHSVNTGSIRFAANTIMATEWSENPGLVSDAGRNDPNSIVVKSHRPLHGFASDSGTQAYLWPPGGGGFGRTVPVYHKCAVDEPGLQADPQAGDQGKLLLNQVGRIHGGGPVAKRKTNFLYCDGHVETKHLFDTLAPSFQWGEQMYSLEPGGDVAP